MEEQEAEDPNAGLPRKAGKDWRSEQ